VATDSSGNVYVADTDNLRIQKFTQAPPVPATLSLPDLDAASDSGNSTDNLTNDDTPTFTGNADEGSTVKIYVDGEEKGSGPATEGNYSVTTSALAEGSHSVTAAASNGSGESDQSPPLTINIDKTAPTVLSVGPLENTSKVARSTNITATFSEEKIDTNTLTSTTVKLEKVGAAKKGTVTYTPVQAAAPTWALVNDPRDGTKQVLKVTLDPNSNLAAGAAYRATVTTEVKDEAGNALAQAKVWNFKAGSK